MPSVRLSTRLVNTVRRDRVTFLWDSQLKGFGVKVTPTAVSWIVQKWQGGRDGKSQRVVIGRYPPMELDEARRRASLAIGEVSNGADLVTRKVQLRLEKQRQFEVPNLETAIVLYLAKNRIPG